MMRAALLLTDPDKAVKVHASAFVFWVLMTIPSVIWWHSSILFVIFISLYAIWIAHLAGMQAALADRRVKHQNGGQLSADSPE
jgi:hypothetical protein